MPNFVAEDGLCTRNQAVLVSELDAVADPEIDVDVRRVRDGIIAVAKRACSRN